MERKVMYNLGCGSIRPEGWINVDSSFTNMLQKLPFGSVITKQFGKKVMQGSAAYMNLNRPWTGVKSCSADVIYASHLFEHLTIKSRNLFLKEAFRTMKPAAAIRLVVPDLELHARAYIAELDKGNVKANEQFLWALNLHREGQYPDGLNSHTILGILQGYPHQHKYMYDQYSLRQVLELAGFIGVVKSSFGRSQYLVNIVDVEFDIEKSYSNSLYLEARKPG